MPGACECGPAKFELTVDDIKQPVLGCKVQHSSQALHDGRRLHQHPRPPGVVRSPGRLWPAEQVRELVPLAYIVNLSIFSRATRAVNGGGRNSTPRPARLQRQRSKGPKGGQIRRCPKVSWVLGGPAEGRAALAVRLATCSVANGCSLTHPTQPPRARARRPLATKRQKRPRRSPRSPRRPQQRLPRAPLLILMLAGCTSGEVRSSLPPGWARPREQAALTRLGARSRLALVLASYLPAGCAVQILPPEGFRLRFGDPAQLRRPRRRRRSGHDFARLVRAHGVRARHQGACRRRAPGASHATD